MTVNTDTWYTIKLRVWAGRLEAWVDGVSGTELSYDLTSPTQIKTGKPALRATTTSVVFDDFKHGLAVPLEPHGRCFAGHSKSQRDGATKVCATAPGARMSDEGTAAWGDARRMTRRCRASGDARTPGGRWSLAQPPGSAPRPPVAPLAARATPQRRAEREVRTRFVGQGNR
jgi:hypothetical protein